ncbi:MAG: hypothetical protein IJ049_00205 [Oscillospiraceae bacterium]|nr:hypothetical protein [Oscillospiraceae bacterium]
MGLLPEYHAVLTCDLPVEQVNHRLSVMPLSVSGTKYVKRETPDSVNHFAFSRPRPRLHPMLKKGVSHLDFLPKVDITTISGTEHTEVRLFFRPEGIVVFHSLSLLAFVLLVEPILISAFFRSPPDHSLLFPIFILPAAFILSLCADTHMIRKYSKHLLTQIAYDLSVYHVPELKRGCSFEQ